MFGNQKILVFGGIALVGLALLGGIQLFRMIQNEQHRRKSLEAGIAQTHASRADLHLTQKNVQALQTSVEQMKTLFQETIVTMQAQMQGQMQTQMQAQMQAQNNTNKNVIAAKKAQNRDKHFASTQKNQLPHQQNPNSKPRIHNPLTRNHPLTRTNLNGEKASSQISNLKPPNIPPPSSLPRPSSSRRLSPPPPSYSPPPGQTTNSALHTKHPPHHGLQSTTTEPKNRFDTPATWKEEEEQEEVEEEEENNRPYHAWNEFHHSGLLSSSPLSPDRYTRNHLPPAPPSSPASPVPVKTQTPPTDYSIVTSKVGEGEYDDQTITLAEQEEDEYSNDGKDDGHHPKNNTNNDDDDDDDYSPDHDDDGNNDEYSIEPNYHPRSSSPQDGGRAHKENTHARHNHHNHHHHDSKHRHEKRRHKHHRKQKAQDRQQYEEWILSDQDKQAIREEAFRRQLEFEMMQMQLLPSNLVVFQTDAKAADCSSEEKVNPFSMKTSRHGQSKRQNQRPVAVEEVPPDSPIEQTSQQQSPSRSQTNSKTFFLASKLQRNDKGEQQQQEGEEDEEKPFQQDDKLKFGEDEDEDEDEDEGEAEDEDEDEDEKEDDGVDDDDDDDDDDDETRRKKSQGKQDEEEEEEWKVEKNFIKIVYFISLCFLILVQNGHNTV